ncbi:MAG TPA: peptidoglycan-associated lipoprotein Pal [Vicinamibacterales bacterium]|nr:peptidoglycan-associated lipoprotein Pal [Vicinamibacterales bacterium]
MKDMRNTTIVVAITLSLAVTAACGKKKIATGPQPPPAEEPAVVTPTPPPPTERVEDRTPVAQPLADESITNKSLDDLNRDSPLKPVFFPLDSAELDESGRAIATANASVLKKYSTWGITVEGHCDERGTAEYNLALGERRAVAVKTYLSSLGVSPERIRTVSYGKEFPFDMGHGEDAWAKNRRGHFVITSK